MRRNCTLTILNRTKYDETVQLLYFILGDFARTWPDHDWPHYTITEPYITIFDLTQHLLHRIIPQSTKPYTCCTVPDLVSSLPCLTFTAPNKTYPYTTYTLGDRVPLDQAKLWQYVILPHTTMHLRNGMSQNSSRPYNHETTCDETRPYNHDIEH